MAGKMKFFFKKTNSSVNHPHQEIAGRTNPMHHTLLSSITITNYKICLHVYYNNCLLGFFFYELEKNK